MLGILNFGILEFSLGILEFPRNFILGILDFRNSRFLGCGGILALGILEFLRNFALGILKFFNKFARNSRIPKKFC